MLYLQEPGPRHLREEVMDGCDHVARYCWGGICTWVDGSPGNLHPGWAGMLSGFQLEQCWHEICRRGVENLEDYNPHQVDSRDRMYLVAAELQSAGSDSPALRHCMTEEDVETGTLGT